MDHHQLRTLIFRALVDQWNKDMNDQVERSPEGHVEALTEAVMVALTTGDLDGH
jgi:hypothetical protein